MGFNRNRVVGEGASAKVYKGSLSSGGEVAVKRFERADKIGCLRSPFTTEFATMVGCLRHKNLVQLHGWCCEGNELVLVYELMPNGSLNKILHKSFNSSVVLSWKQRLNIVLGVASALAYLHEEKRMSPLKLKNTCRGSMQCMLINRAIKQAANSQSSITANQEHTEKQAKNEAQLENTSSLF
ncbi:hypothetical protein GBA52_026461 [Prunus armeniaca]|nr:hypothetical protein GBA52_026461 [Prunus armeniaca]